MGNSASTYDFNAKTYKAVNYGKGLVVPLEIDGERIDLRLNKGFSFDITTEEQAKIFERYPYVDIESEIIIVEVDPKIIKKKQNSIEASKRMKEAYRKAQEQNSEVNKNG